MKKRSTIVRDERGISNVAVIAVITIVGVIAAAGVGYSIWNSASSSVGGADMQITQADLVKNSNNASLFVTVQNTGGVKLDNVAVTLVKETTETEVCLIEDIGTGETASGENYSIGSVSQGETYTLAFKASATDGSTLNDTRSVTVTGG